MVGTQEQLNSNLSVVRYKSARSSGFWADFTRGFGHEMQGRFEESKHPRGHKGTEKGGRFVSKGGGGGSPSKVSLPKRPPAAATSPTPASKPFGLSVHGKDYQFAKYQGGFLYRPAGVEGPWKRLNEQGAAQLKEHLDHKAKQGQAEKDVRKGEAESKQAAKRTDRNKRYIMAWLKDGPIKGNTLWNRMDIPKDDFLDAFFALDKEGKIQQDSKTGMMRLTDKPDESSSPAKLSPAKPPKPPKIAPARWAEMTPEQQEAIQQTMKVGKPETKPKQSPAKHPDASPVALPKPTVVKPERTPEQDAREKQANEKQAKELSEVPFRKPGSPVRYSLAQAFKSEYDRRERELSVARYAMWFREYYAKMGAGKQSFTWTEEDEAKHPRNADGEWTGTGGREENSPKSPDKPLTALSGKDRLPGSEEPITQEVEGQPMDKSQRLIEIDEALKGFSEKGGAGLDAWTRAAEALRSQPDSFWDEHKNESTKKLLRGFREGWAKPAAKEIPNAEKKNPQKPVELPPLPTLKQDKKRDELLQQLDAIGLNGEVKLSSRTGKPCLILRGNTKPLCYIIKEHGGIYSPTKGDKDDPRWFIEGPRKIIACLESLIDKATAEKQQQTDTEKDAARVARRAEWQRASDEAAAKRRAAQEAARQERARVASDEKSKRRKAGWTVSGNTYPIRDALRSAGGIWDADNQQWLMPSEEVTNTFREKLGQKGKAEVTSEVTSDKAIRLSTGSGYVSRHFTGWRAGDVVHNDPEKIAAGEPEWLYVLSGNSRYIREDGLSFGVGDESGYIYNATARPATDEEAAPARARIAVKAARTAAHEALLATAKHLQSMGERPEGHNSPEGETIPIGQGQTIYGSGDWYVIGPEWIWYVKNNGADGDDWSLNNVRTGGAGAIGWRIPYDPTVAESIRNNSENAKEIANV